VSARCAQEVARVKMASLAEGEVPVFYRPEREAQVLKRVMEQQGAAGQRRDGAVVPRNHVFVPGASSSR
jgi:chorismate mutase